MLLFSERLCAKVVVMPLKLLSWLNKQIINARLGLPEYSVGFQAYKTDQNRRDLYRNSSRSVYRSCIAEFILCRVVQNLLTAEEQKIHVFTLSSKNCIAACRTNSSRYSGEA